jgi:hypothetical protein
MKNAVAKQLRHYRRKACRELRRKQQRLLTRASRRKNNQRRAMGQQNVVAPSSKPQYPATRKAGKTTLRAPRSLSILNNRDETLRFFATLKTIGERGKRVILDLSAVDDLTCDSLLYMLWLIEYINTRTKPGRVSGNLPNDPLARQIFCESGFLKYVRSSIPLPANTLKLLAIETGHDVSPQIAQKVVDFTRHQLNAKRSIATRRTYEIIIESMANTKNHAYGNASTLPSWYLVALKRPECHKVSFAFLDGGLGIPKTVKKRNWEAFREKVKLLRPSDGDIIMSTLRGELRTQTGEHYRGKGLPKIFKSVELKEIDSLTVVSNRGFVSCDFLNAEYMAERFYGTLLCWNFTWQNSL